jgi:hypothetical protein
VMLSGCSARCTAARWLASLTLVEPSSGLPLVLKVALQCGLPGGAAATFAEGRPSVRLPLFLLLGSFAGGGAAVIR